MPPSRAVTPLVFVASFVAQRFSRPSYNKRCTSVMSECPVSVRRAARRCLRIIHRTVGVPAGCPTCRHRRRARVLRGRSEGMIHLQSPMVEYHADDCSAAQKYSSSRAPRSGRRHSALTIIQKRPRNENSQTFRALCEIGCTPMTSFKQPGHRVRIAQIRPRAYPTPPP